MTPKQLRLKKLLDKISTPDEVEMRAFSLFSKSLNESAASLASTDKDIVDYIDSLDKAFGKRYGEIESKISDNILKSKKDISEIDFLLRAEISATKELVKNVSNELKLTKKEVNTLLKKIQKDIEDLFWVRSNNGSNNVQAVLNIKLNGVTIANNVTGINFVNGTAVLNPDGTINYTGAGGSTTWYSGNNVSRTLGVQDSVNTTFTLPRTPTANSLFWYLNGQLLTDGSVDYTLAGAVITMNTPPFSNDILTYKFQ